MPEYLVKGELVRDVGGRRDHDAEALGDREDVVDVLGRVHGEAHVAAVHGLEVVVADRPSVLLLVVLRAVEEDLAGLVAELAGDVGLGQLVLAVLRAEVGASGDLHDVQGSRLVALRLEVHGEELVGVRIAHLDLDFGLAHLGGLVGSF